MSIEIVDICKYFNNFNILNKISFNIPSKKIVALLGPSGSGKTTLLRIIAGLEYPNKGIIKFYNKNVTNLHARDRKIGFVFQNYALFRHMTVFNNIIFGLKMVPKKKRLSFSLIKKKATDILEMIKLQDFANRYPSQLSGGQQQRVALARSLITQPKILLLDEPFGALDTQVRKELRKWLKKLHKELKFTSIFVTHDQDEAMEIAHRIVIMSKGCIEQEGTPKEIWCSPATSFVVQFFGEVNKFIGEIKGSNFFVGVYYCSLGYTPSYQGKVEIFLRPWEIEVSNFSSLDTPLPIKVIEFNLIHSFWQVLVHAEWHSNEINLMLNINFFKNLSLIKGKKLFIGLKKAIIYSKNTLLTKKYFFPN